MGWYAGSGEEGYRAEKRYSDVLLLRVLGSEMLQSLFICHEQRDADGVGVVISLEAFDT